MIVDKFLNPICKFPRLEVATARKEQRIDINVKPHGPRNNKRKKKLQGHICKGPKGDKKKLHGHICKGQKNLDHFFIYVCHRGHVNFPCIVLILSDVSEETITLLRSSL